MMTPVLRQGWVVKQNMMWWWYFLALLYRNIIKPSKHLQGGILTVTYCTFWIDIINKYYTFAQIGLKIKVFMIVMKWPKSSIEYCMECVDLCIQLSIRQSVARCPPERSGGWPALYLNKDLLVLKLFVHFFANCSLLYLFVIWYMFACVPQHTGQERVWSACPSITSSNYHHPLVRWMMTQ